MEVCSVFTNEKMRALRDPEYRAQLTGFDHPAGLVDENELKELVGASEANTTTITVCQTTITICPPSFIGVTLPICCWY